MFKLNTMFLKQFNYFLYKFRCLFQIYIILINIEKNLINQIKTKNEFLLNILSFKIIVITK